MVRDDRERLRRERLIGRRARLVSMRVELAQVVGRELAALGPREARRLGRRFFRLGELVARIDRRLV